MLARNARERLKPLSGATLDQVEFVGKLRLTNALSLKPLSGATLDQAGPEQTGRGSERCLKPLSGATLDQESAH